MTLENGLRMKIVKSEPLYGRFALERNDGQTFSLLRPGLQSKDYYLFALRNNFGSIVGNNRDGIITGPECAEILRGINDSKKIAVYQPYHDGAFLVIPLNENGEPETSKSEVIHPIDYLGKVLVPPK